MLITNIFSISNNISNILFFDAFNPLPHNPVF